jgi:hypothetical protein
MLVREEHLNAAFAFWKYSEASAALIFEEKQGNPDAEKLLAALKKAGTKGLTKSEIHTKVFLTKKPKEDRDKLLSDLVTFQQIHMVQRPTAGRTVNIFYCGPAPEKPETSGSGSK